MPNQIRDDLYKVDKDSFPYIFEQNVTVTLKDNKGLVRCNVYRPKDDKIKYPALVTYGPYGKACAPCLHETTRQAFADL